MLLCLTLNNPQSRRIPLPASPARSHRPDAGPRIARPSAGFRVPSNADAGPSAGGSPTGRLGSHRRRGGTQTEPNPDSDSWSSAPRNPPETPPKWARKSGEGAVGKSLARSCLPDTVHQPERTVRLRGRPASATGLSNGATPASSPLSWCRSRPTAIR